MTDAELISLLKDRLSLQVVTKQVTEFGPVERVYVKVTLLVGDVEITSADDRFDLPSI